MYYNRRRMMLEYLYAYDATFHPLAKVVSTKSLCHKATNFLFEISKYIVRGIWLLYKDLFFWPHSCLPILAFLVFTVYDNYSVLF